MKPAPKRLVVGRAALPTAITLSSLLCGFVAIVLAIRAPQDAVGVALCAALIGAAILLDMLDGRVARLTGGASAFGAELDSLCDLVAFGVAPSLLAYELGLNTLGAPGALCAFAFTACGALRLARFNVLWASGQSDGRWFMGLSIPVAAASLTLAAAAAGTGMHGRLPPIVLALTAVNLAVLMVSRVRYPTFKGASGRLWLIAGALFGILATGLSLAIGPVAALALLVNTYVGVPPTLAVLARVRRRAAPASAMTTRVVRSHIAREALGALAERGLVDRYLAFFQALYGTQLAGVIFYGSCLSPVTRGASSTPDFFVVTDDGAIPGHPRPARWLHRWLAPNSLSGRLPGLGGGHAFKYVHLDLAQLARATSPSAPDLFVAGRLSKRVKLVYWRDHRSRDRLVGALEGAAQLVAEMALAGLPETFSVDDFMYAYAGLSYLSEWRIDAAGKVDSLVASAPAYYSRLCARLLAGRRRADRVGSAGPRRLRHEPRPGARRRVRRLLARSRRRAALRWPKYLLTMPGAAEVVTSKIRRAHPELRLPQVFLRHPFVFALPLVIALLCAGTIKTHRARRSP